MDEKTIIDDFFASLEELAEEIDDVKR